MRIDGNRGLDFLSIFKNENINTKSEKNEKVKEQRDEVNFSSDYEIQLGEYDQSRSDKVQKIKEMINNGEYNITGREVVEKWLGG